LFESFGGWRYTYPERIVTRRTCDAWDIAEGGGYFERSHQTALVEPIYRFRPTRVAFFEHRKQLVSRFFLKLFPQFLIYLDIWQHDAAEERVDIKSGASRDDGQLAPRDDIVDGTRRALYKIVCRKRLFWRNDIE